MTACAASFNGRLVGAPFPPDRQSEHFREHRDSAVRAIRRAATAGLTGAVFGNVPVQFINVGKIDFCDLPIPPPRPDHVLDRCRIAVRHLTQVARLPRPRFNSSMPSHSQKITFGEMRASGVRGLLIYCSDYQCSHWTAISSDPWPDDARLSDIEPRFTCQACGMRGADVRPNFHWEKPRLRQDNVQSWTKLLGVSFATQTEARRSCQIAERSSPGVGDRDGTRLLRPQAAAA